MGDLGFCQSGDIVTAVFRQLLADFSSDGGVPLFVVRALHNKIIAYFILTLRCYIGYFDTEMLFGFVSSFLLPFLFSAALLPKFRRVLLSLLLLIPLFFIFNPLRLDLGARISSYTWFFMLMAIIGCLKLILVFRAWLTRK